jgi:acyl-CoA hydrolase
VEAYTSLHSIGVTVSMRHGNGPQPHHVVDGYMTFVALDENGTPLQVPQRVPQTPAELARFREGVLRREFRSKLQAGLLPPESSAISIENRPIFIRELLKMFPHLRLPWERDTRPRARHHSYVHKIEMVRASKLNFHGTLYGGTLMRWIETTANLSARAYLKGKPVRMSGLHGLSFIRAARRDSFVHIRAAVVHTTPTSLTTLVTVQGEDPLSGQFEDTLRAFLTFEPVVWQRDDTVPPLECSGDEERALYDEACHRLALQRTLQENRL